MNGLDHCQSNLSQSVRIAKPGSSRVEVAEGVSGGPAGGRVNPALDWGLRGNAPVIHSSGKPALQNRIHPAAFEPIWHSVAISRLALIERAQRFSITIFQ